MKLTSGDIQKIVKGDLTGDPAIEVTDIVTDSRQLTFTDGMAFFAIRGKNHDGHNFILNLLGKGIRVFVAERIPGELKKNRNVAIIVVEDTVRALQELASYKRTMFRSPVVAVTGSAGKTIVKEWLADILSLALPVVRSPRSYNSQIGVPLSVWKLDEKYKLAIFEAGISFPGEMDNLRRVIDPGIGVITNVGEAHGENFRSIESKASEKLKLFLNASKIIYCSDHFVIANLLKNDSQYNKKELIGWSFENKNASVFVEKKIMPGNKTSAKLFYNKQTYNLLIPFTDRASVENAVTAASVCLVLGISPEIIMEGISSLVSVAMRMELKSGINNCHLIEDFYNSDPGSLGMALEFLKSQNTRKTTLILSDFIQSGRDEKELYTEVAEGIRKAGIDRLIGIGPRLTANRDLFDPGSTFCYSTDEFINRVHTFVFEAETILLKGARKFEFEKIGMLLEHQVHQTLLEVNLDAISHNLNEFRRHLQPETRVMAMVKAFAYGTGPSEIAGLLEYHRVSYLGVAYADEGIALRSAGVTLPVMVMNPDPGSYEVMIRYNLEPEIYNLESFDSFNKVASRHGLVQYPVHIKIDSGMHRLGFMPGEIDTLAGRIRTADALKIASVFSHLAAGDDPAFDDFTHLQVNTYLEAAAKIQAAAGYSFIMHICNSAAIIRFPQYQFGMVRPGIGIYGVGKFDGLDLRPAGRFKSRISQVKKIPAGEPVGYGCADVSASDRIIGIVPVGYADGLNRRLGNRNGYFIIKNKKAPLVGNICMDMCMTDITDIDAQPGDEVEIFGENIRIEELAEKCGTIPYEILTSIPPRVKRIFFRQ